MKKNLAIFLLTFSFALVLVHSILPHNHVEGQFPSLEITTPKSLSLADIIKHSLARDLGSKHLEDYEECTISYNINFDFIVAEICEPNDATALLEDTNHDDVIVTFVFSHYLPNIGLRAPPYIS